MCYNCRFSYAKNWELVKSIAGTNLEQAMFLYILKPETGYDSFWLCSSSLCYDKKSFLYKTDTGDTIKYSRIPKNTQAQQKNTNDNTKKTIKINWDWSKKVS